MENKLCHLPLSHIEHLETLSVFLTKLIDLSA